MFSGSIRIKVCEADGLRPTDYQIRHNFGKADGSIDPYVSIDVDENHLGKKRKIVFPFFHHHSCRRLCFLC